MLSYSITQISICVPLTEEQWDKLEDLDDTWKFIEELQKVGAQDVDWNGHFGRNIFFTADADHDYGRTMLPIENVEVVVNKIEEWLR